VQVYQSRIFTEQGGDIDLFSANGDLNAGKGKKSSASYPPLKLTLDIDGYSHVNPTGLVTGAGIGALLSVPGQDPNLSNVNLVAPRGIVDAGAAGIRVAGNLNIAALQVLNAFNITVTGSVTGLPTVVGPPVAALTAANNTAGSAVRTEAPTQNGASDAASVIIVEFLGFGGEGDGNNGDDQQQRDRQDEIKQRQRQSYDPADPVKVVGYGSLSDLDMRNLTEEERQKLASH
jgi:hypothetical protein